MDTLALETEFNQIQSLEALAQHIRQFGMTQERASQVNMLVEGNVVSTEHFTQYPTMAGKHEALEGIASGIKRVVKKIIEMVRKFIQKIKGMFKTTAIVTSTNLLAAFSKDSKIDPNHYNAYYRKRTNEIQNAQGDSGKHIGKKELEGILAKDNHGLKILSDSYAKKIDTQLDRVEKYLTNYSKDTPPYEIQHDNVVDIGYLKHAILQPTEFTGDAKKDAYQYRLLIAGIQKVDWDSDVHTKRIEKWTKQLEGIYKSLDKLLRYGADDDVGIDFSSIMTELELVAREIRLYMMTIEVCSDIVSNMTSDEEMK